MPQRRLDAGYYIRQVRSTIAEPRASARSASPPRVFVLGSAQLFEHSRNFEKVGQP